MDEKEGEGKLEPFRSRGRCRRAREDEDPAAAGEFSSGEEHGNRGGDSSARVDEGREAGERPEPEGAKGAEQREIDATG